MHFTSIEMTGIPDCPQLVKFAWTLGLLRKGLNISDDFSVNSSTLYCNALKNDHRMMKYITIKFNQPELLSPSL